VFDTDSNEIIFFTASRGHHADIGGILPGSMPPTSVNIFEEGAEIVSFKIVDGGVFDQKGLYEYMVDKPAQYPGSSGCRNIKDVESDLKAVSHEPLYILLAYNPRRSKSLRTIKGCNSSAQVSAMLVVLCPYSFCSSRRGLWPGNRARIHGTYSSKCRELGQKFVARRGETRRLECSDIC
jgi:hypothetical protein